MKIGHDTQHYVSGLPAPGPDDEGDGVGDQVVVGELSKNLILPFRISLNLNVIDCSLSMCFLDWNRNVLPLLARMENPVPVHPTFPNILNRVKDDPFVRVIDEIKISKMRQEVGLHNPKFHGLFSNANKIINA